jgi:hypothetical protein
MLRPFNGATAGGHETRPQPRKPVGVDSTTPLASYARAATASLPLSRPLLPLANTCHLWASHVAGGEGPPRTRPVGRVHLDAHSCPLAE